MFIVSYYFFWIVYGGLVLYAMPGALWNPTDGIWYAFVGLAILVGWIGTFLMQFVILAFLGWLRHKKPITDITNHRIANSLLKLGLHLIRTKVIVTGKDNIPKEHFIMVGNHQENYDILIIKPQLKDIPISYVAKEALRKMPVIGWWMELLGNVFISRYADRSAAESIITSIKHYKEGMSMGIYPEGKRSFGNEMIEFKAGAFKLAMKPKADILIVTQYDTCKIFKTFPWRPYRVYIHIHPLLKYEDYQAMHSQELSDYVKAEIQKQLDVFAATIK